MSFRKRNVGVKASSASSDLNKATGTAATRIGPTAQVVQRPISALGVRPSPLDGSPITSTGTPSLDNLLAGYGGIVLGSLILVEESGATDYAGTLLRYYAAEGLLQKHRVHVIGVDEYWARDLPGVATTKDGTDAGEKSAKGDPEKMKIAWRYERFGDSSPRAGPSSSSSDGKLEPGRRQVFCHNFDLTKRLESHDPSLIDILPIRLSSLTTSPFASVLKSLSKELSSTSDPAIHRIVIPSVLTPAHYPPHAALPQHVLQFFHALRSLLRTYPSRLSAMVSLPISLYPRGAGLTRWMEILSDGVLELAPFPHTVDTGLSLATSGAATAHEEKPQGMAKIHRLPVVHERGSGGTGSAGVGDDLAFTVTRRRFEIKPFSLPPIDGDTEAQKGEADGRPTKIDIDF